MKGQGDGGGSMKRIDEHGGIQKRGRTEDRERWREFGGSIHKQDGVGMSEVRGGEEDK